MTSKEAWERLLAKGGKYFRVAFRRKHNQRNGPGKAGDIRWMTCRINVLRYTNAVTGLGRSIPPEERRSEDLRCDVLTAFDTEVFHQLRREGYGRVQAGRRSYRRINCAEVLYIS